MNKIKINLLGKIVIAVALGILMGQFFPASIVRLFLTFNGVFSNFLAFSIPLIILGFVTPAIGEIGRGVGKMLVVTIILSYGATICAGFLSYFTSDTFFPVFIDAQINAETISEAQTLSTYFDIPMPPLMDIMTALVLSFVVGAGLTAIKSSGKILFTGVCEFREIVSGLISNIIIPLLPVYIFGIFLNMTFTGEV